MLTGKQKSQLRSLGQTMADDARLGKEGLSDKSIGHLRELLRRKELVKLRFTEVEGDDRKMLAEQAAEAAEAELVTVVGRTALLYRPNPELDASKRVLGQVS